MYFIFLIIKTFNGMLAAGIFIYTVIMAFLFPALRKKNKSVLMIILGILPLILSLIHLAVYGNLCFRKFRFLYLESLLPLVNLLPGKSFRLNFSKSFISAVSSFAVFLYFLINAVSHPMIHNYSRDSYTKGFKKMISTLKKEYCLNSWKQIDYDALLETYLPQIEEAEKNNDKTAYASVLTEFAYRFYDSHVRVDMPVETQISSCSALAGNDYGLSMVRTDDGNVIAVLVDPLDQENQLGMADEECNLHKLGIHDGTQILSWDGLDINEAIENVECIYPIYKFPVKMNEDVFRPVFLAGKGGESVDVTFLNDSGKEQTVTLKKSGDYSSRLDAAFIPFENYYNDYSQNETCMLDEKCGYLRIMRESFDTLSDNIAALRKGYYPKLTEYYAEKIEGLISEGMEYLIIDIRYNGGGYDDCAGALASLFTDEKRHMVSFGYEDDNGYHIKESQYIFPDGRYKDLPVAVLVNFKCVSAGDGMAKFLGDCSNVTLMGITASAGVNQNNGGYIYLADDICFYYPCFLSLSSENEPLIDTDYTRENRIPLDVIIPLTKESATDMFYFEKLFNPQKYDYEMKFAAEYLRNKAESDAGSVK